jgi:hypothetical protein
MALLKTSGEILSLRGQYGGMYFKNDNIGLHLQSMPRSIRKASMEHGTSIPSGSDGWRGFMAGSFSSCAWEWWLMVAAGVVLLWVAFGDEWILQYGAEQGRTLNDFQWHMHFNVPRKAKQWPLWWRPPKSPKDLPDAVTTTEYTALDHRNFYEDGQYNNKTLFRSMDGLWYCWWLDPSWIISNSPGQSEIPPYWYRFDLSAFGEYTPILPEFQTSFFHE